MTQEWRVSYPRCESCDLKLERLWTSQKIEGYRCWILYKYNDFFKSLLYRYKGLGERALSPGFLKGVTMWFWIHFEKAAIILPPVHLMDDDRRGFSPLKEIFKHVGPCYQPFFKQGDYKQSDQSFPKRKDIGHHLRVEESQLNTLKSHQKLVCVDDVLTSGETMKWMLQQLKRRGFKNLHGFVLAHPTKA